MMNTEERYEILDKDHGKGGFGQIQKQRDRVLERLVAVKKLHMLVDPESRERFIREAKTLAAMSHPNVPAIYDVKFSDDETLIYFEFIEGENLRQVIESGQIPSIHQAVSWFSQVASALEHAHSLGIIHRDVKPENIIIAKNGAAAYLVDFGIALNPDDVRRITERGYVIGTPAYMSPEQREGDEVTSASDIYTVGITLYETLCGRLPMGGHYEPLSDSNEAVPPSIDELIKACLITDPVRRLSSAKEFRQRLRSSFRTDVPLSVLLMDARLHELHAALQTMSAEEFAAKPKGQKLLILTRTKDLIRTDKPQLQKATADMIALLVRLAINEPEDQYRPIVEAAYEWGFEKIFGRDWRGDEGIRDALTDAAKVAPSAGHTVLSKALINFLGRIGLEGKKGWYYHDLRVNLINLLANPHCETAADELAELYNQVNEISH